MGCYRELAHRDNPIVIKELLALEEHVGEANTGLKRRVISALMTRHKYRAKMSGGDNCCCICFETYVDGEKNGKLDCGHEFHDHCIRKWLRSRTALTIAWLFESGLDDGSELFK